MMTLALEPVDLADLIHTGLSVVREKAQARGIHLHGEVDTQGLRMQVDARKCKQILYNLLANAVKFTPDGGQVRVRARRVERAAVERPLTPGWSGFRLPLPASAAESFVEIVIADTGIGMPAGKLDTLFQPFVQIDSSLGRKYEGSGLGLAMVRRLAELHGGTVAVASAEGQGSVFAVWLPIIPISEKSENLVK